MIGALTRLADLARDDLVTRACRCWQRRRALSPRRSSARWAPSAGNLCQETRCWYYRYPDDTFHCHRKGGELCAAAVGDNRYHSIFGSARVVDPPCVVACPNHNGIPIYLEVLRRLDVDDAARLLLAREPAAGDHRPRLPARVRGGLQPLRPRRSPVDPRPRARVGDYALAHPELFLGCAPPATGKHVTVVGSGPAGLTAAYFLRRHGHAVTVIEREKRGGGMLALGIPPFRLDRPTW